MAKLCVPPGTEFGRLTVIDEVSSAGAPRRFKCRCQCGLELVAILSELRRGNTKSCGCLSAELRSRAITRRNTKHGDSDSRTHRIWRAMKSRCNNPNASNYDQYGGSSIAVCSEWQKSYEQFLADMGECPTSKHSIDRFPNQEGPYAPGNCRWATAREQNRNRRDNVMLTFEGKTMCLTDWATELGIHERTLRNRIKHYGWTTEDALSTPVGQKR